MARRSTIVAVVIAAALALAAGVYFGVGRYGGDADARANASMAGMPMRAPMLRPFWH
jgi:hypothetical protein